MFFRRGDQAHQGLAGCRYPRGLDDLLASRRQLRKPQTSASRLMSSSESRAGQTAVADATSPTLPLPSPARVKSSTRSFATAMGVEYKGSAFSETAESSPTDQQARTVSLEPLWPSSEPTRRGLFSPPAGQSKLRGRRLTRDVSAVRLASPMCPESGSQGIAASREPEAAKAVSSRLPWLRVTAVVSRRSSVAADPKCAAAAPWSSGSTARGSGGALRLSSPDGSWSLARWPRWGQPVSTSIVSVAETAA